MRWTFSDNCTERLLLLHRHLLSSCDDVRFQLQRLLNDLGVLNLLCILLTNCFVCFEFVLEVDSLHSEGR